MGHTRERRPAPGEVILRSVCGFTEAAATKDLVLTAATTGLPLAHAAGGPRITTNQTVRRHDAKRDC